MKKGAFEELPVRMAVKGLRQNNERAVMSAVAFGGGVSAAELARTTGLGAQTVARIVNGLEARSLVYRGEARRGQRGQPAVPIYIDPVGAYSIGCDIGWRSLTMLIRDMGGQVLHEYRIDYPYPNAKFILSEVTRVVEVMIGLVPEQLRSRVIGIGVAMPTDIGRNIGRLGAPLELAQYWRDFDLVGELTRSTRLRVRLLNDGNAACWGELAAQPPPRPSNMVYFLIGTFVGAGLIAQGKLWEGPTGNSANLGSMLVTDSNGEQNFVHMIASIHALEQRIAAAGREVPVGNPLDWDWAALEPLASAWIDDAARAIAKAIANTAAVMEFDDAVVDGIMPRAITERLVNRVRDYTERLPVMTSDRARISIGHRGARAGAMGAALKPMFERFYSRDPADMHD
ncbi:MAG: ROK family transcriptional regulator [Alphaproteobacteria bacterium]|nr:ROK family transcriptional regulator [Alphaproteobacteria bacterium]